MRFAAIAATAADALRMNAVGFVAQRSNAGEIKNGNFAAVVAIVCRDAGVRLAAQVLLYAATDMTRDSNPHVRRAYFGEGYDTNSRNPKASPLFARLEGVAPAIMAVGRHDFLYQDNLAYATALTAAKVPLVFREFPSLNHGFFSYTAISPACLAAAEKTCEDLKALLAGGR